MLALGAILMRILMLVHTGSMWFASWEHNQLLPHNARGERADLERNAQLLSHSVASLCCFHSAKWCLSGLSAPQAQDLITAIFLSLWSSTVSAPTLQRTGAPGRADRDFYGQCCRALWRTRHMMNHHKPRKRNNNNWYCHLKTWALLSEQHSGIWFVFSQISSAAGKKAGIDYANITEAALLHLTLFRRQSWFTVVASCFRAAIVVQTYVQMQIPQSEDDNPNEPHPRLHGASVVQHCCLWPRTSCNPASLVLDHHWWEEDVWKLS